MDSFGRVHNNLRISVTDRCNLRCTYCMPEDVTFLDRGELLTFEEIASFVRVAANLGVNKIRLTGGEPLMRRDLHKLVRMIVSVSGITDIGLTTNGILLAEQAAQLFDAGLRRLNVSLDTLDPDRFRALARRGGVEKVLAGLNAAKRAGFDPIKINAVAIRGFAEHDVVPLAQYCKDNSFELRFIEYMPIGADSWEREKVFFAAEILELIGNEVGPLVPAPADPSAPALDYAYRDGSGTVGVIASVSRPFCRSCNRIRLTADGKLRNCLFALDETDVKGLLRSLPINDETIRNALRQSVWAKWEGHEINAATFVKPDRTMHAIGG
ncbi:Cyclic pyranopterin monophosphate synthase [Gemmata sp. SH-PL17]|nr:GTP 3',8-cyclase MoaA [Gemmata sp. SH-PL17]AMV30278.1 Cyclic pyranopterin monophosphate synthase [Gemmata sp. SH-PL17]